MQGTYSFADPLNNRLMAGRGCASAVSAEISASRSKMKTNIPNKKELHLKCKNLALFQSTFSHLLGTLKLVFVHFKVRLGSGAYLPQFSAIVLAKLRPKCLIYFPSESVQGRSLFGIPFASLKFRKSQDWRRPIEFLLQKIFKFLKIMSLLPFLSHNPFDD